MRRCRHHVQVASLLGRQTGLQAQLGHAQNAVHGRANFMAHVGQKVTFGSIGRLCGVPRHGQIFFGVLTRFHEFVEGVGDHLDLTADHLGNGGDHLPIAHAGRCLVHGQSQHIQGAHHPRHKEPQQRCHHQQQQTTECQHFSVEVFDRRKGLCRGHHRSHDPSRAGQFFEGEQPFDTPRVDTLLCALKTFHGIFKREVTAVRGGRS